MQHTVNDIPLINFDLEGKVILITGGTKGLGYASAVTFARRGAKIAVAARTVSDCERVQEELNSLGCEAIAIPTDVTVRGQIDDMVAKTVERFGRIDILLNNAGKANTMKAVDVTEEAWDDIVDLDLKAVFFVAQAVAKQMIAQGAGGKIVNVASLAGVIGSKGIANYCAAKAGVVNLTRSLALEWAKYGILVNAVCPGYFLTSLNEDMMAKPSVKKGIEDFTLVKRLATFDEIVAPILLLVSDHSGYMTGTHIVIDGGGTAD